MQEIDLITNKDYLKNEDKIKKDNDLENEKTTSEKGNLKTRQTQKYDNP